MLMISLGRCMIPTFQQVRLEISVLLKFLHFAGRVCSSTLKYTVDIGMGWGWVEPRSQSFLQERERKGERRASIPTKEERRGNSGKRPYLPAIF